MSTVVRVAAFLAGLAVVFSAAWAVGAGVGPVGADASDAAADHGGGDHGDHPADTTPATPGGLAVAQDGYRLRLADAVLEPGPREVAFSVVGPDGPVTDYEVQHEKELHLIVVRRDFAGFQHVHPTLDPDTGTWTTTVDLTAGPWRVFADFVPAGGEALTLASDLLVPGSVEPPRASRQVRTDTVDGYTITLDGDLRPGTHSGLELTVERDGEPVADLEPYLGAYGHLVALREGDLAYLHVHPGGTPGDGSTEPGPTIGFGAEVPSAGRYHLYLDFKHDGVVRTAHLVLDAGDVEADAPGDHAEHEPHDH